MVQGEIGADHLGECGSDEGLEVPVGGRVAGDRFFEVIDGTEGALYQALSGELRVRALDGVKPGTRSRHEIERPSRIVGELGQHAGVLVAE